MISAFIPHSAPLICFRNAYNYCIANPAKFLKGAMNPNYYYGYMTVPQPGFADQPTLFPRCVLVYPLCNANSYNYCVVCSGRGLGGTSLVNWMIWNLPAREEVKGPYQWLL